MYAYCMLSPQAAEMIQLRAEGVALHRIFALYPLDVREITGWLFEVVGDEPNSITKFSEEIVATTSVTCCHQRAKFEVGPTSLSNEHIVAFYNDGYEDLIRSKAGQRWEAAEKEASKPYPSWTQRFVAELLWIGSHWNELVELHQWEQAHVDDLLLLARLLAEAGSRKGECVKVGS